MKSLHIVRYPLIAAAVAAAAVVSTPAAAELSASAGVTNVYLWRGYNLSGGAPAVFGGLEYGTEAGAYAGVWGTNSGALNQEVDLYAGFRGESGDFSYNLSVYDYEYPEDDTVQGADTHSSDYQEAIINLGYKGFTLDASIGVGDTGGAIVNADAEETNEATYVALGYGYEKFGVKVGSWNGNYDDLAYAGGTPVETNFTHVDLSYKYNDRLTFVVSKIVDDDDGTENDPVFQMSYALPIDIDEKK